MKRKKVLPLHEIPGSRMEVLEQEGLICAPLSIDKNTFKQDNPQGVSDYKKYHNKFGSKMNSPAAKSKFVDIAMHVKYPKLNAKITLV